MSLLSRALAFFRRRRVNPQEDEQRLLPGAVKTRTVQGVVTRVCGDYGLINESIYFSADVVISNVPLVVGHKVFAVVEEDKSSFGLNAIEVEAVGDHFDDSGPSNPGTKVLIGYVTSVMKDTVYINEGTSFCLDTVCEVFVPCKGDWLEVVYSTEPGMTHIKALSVKPMNSRHVDEVRITSVHGRHGVIDHNIFFTLDSLKLPLGYVPRQNDVVNVVVVESTQAPYFWRAVSMTHAHGR